MENKVNNNQEINEMFGTQDTPVVPPPQPDLQASQTFDNFDPSNATMGNDPGFNLASKVMFSEDSQYLADSDSGDSDNTSIGDHNAFGFVKMPKRKVSVPFLLVILVVIISFAGGGLGCYAYFFGLDPSSDYSAAKTSAEGVYEYIDKHYSPEKIIIADIYVNAKVSSYECIVLTVVESAPAKYENMMFRVAVEKNKKDYEIYKAFNQEEYDALNAGTELEKAEAAIMDGQKRDFELTLNEILSGKGGWVNIDPVMFNVRMNKD